MRGFGILILLFAACADPENVSPNKPQGKNGPECGHGGLDSDPHNCGECGHDCTQLAGVLDATCQQGSCKITCAKGRAHCSSSAEDGCEADLSSPTSCGACGITCTGVCAPASSGFACQSSCGANTTDCGGQCVDTSGDVGNCGGCGQACPAPANGQATCSGGQCGLTCDTGFDLQNGACVSTQPAGTWLPVDSGTGRSLFAVWGSPSGDIFVAGNRGKVLTAPRGGTFGTIVSYSADDYAAIWGLDSDHILSVGFDTANSQGAIFRPLADGSWDGLGFMAFAPAATWGSDFEHVYIVGSGGSIRHATDGHTWATEDGGTTQQLWGVWGAGSDVWAVGAKGTILRSKAGTWSAETSGTTTDLLGVWGASPSDLVAVGRAGLVLHSIGDGKWSPETSGTSEDFFNIGGFGNETWAVGANGTIAHRAAATWTSESSGVTVSLYSVWGSAMDGVFAVGEGGTILHR